MASDPHTRLQAKLDRAVWQARLVMLLERSGAVWAPLALGCGLIAVAGLWGLFDRLPDMADAAVVALVLLTALGFAGFGARHVRLPTREAARARVEADSGLEHAPLSSLDDAPAAGSSELWDLHRARALQAVEQTRVGPPRGGFAAADPFALRYLLLMAGVLALWARGAERAPEAVHAFRPVGQATTVSVRAIGSLGDTAMRTVSGWIAPKPQVRVEAPAIKAGVSRVKTEGRAG